MCELQQYKVLNAHIDASNTVTTKTHFQYSALLYVVSHTLVQLLQSIQPPANHDVFI